MIEIVLIRAQIGRLIQSELKNQRKNILNLSQENMAHHLWLNVSEYQSLEQGKTKDPRISTMLKIALRLGISLDDLFGLDGKVPKTAFDVV